VAPNTIQIGQWRLIMHITVKTGIKKRDGENKNDRMSRNTKHKRILNIKGTIKKMSFQMAFKSGC